jgi:hypothetical protein
MERGTVADATGDGGAKGVFTATDAGAVFVDGVFCQRKKKTVLSAIAPEILCESTDSLYR